MSFLHISYVVLPCQGKGQVGELAGLLDICGFDDAGLQYHRSAFGLLKFSVAVATENKSMDGQQKTVEEDRGGRLLPG
jgi:hypothetical protein